MFKPRARQYSVEHTTIFRYEKPVFKSALLLCLQPRSDLQLYWDFQLKSSPKAIPQKQTDNFGNFEHLLSFYEQHSELEISTRFIAQTITTVTYLPRLTAKDWLKFSKIAPLIQYWNFLKPSHFVRMSPQVLDFMEQKDIKRLEDPLTTLVRLVSIIYYNFSYSPGSTLVNSPIEQIIETGQGVCQDYTHVFLTIARYWGIPARYVSGYIELTELPNQPEPIGATHAWAECYLPKVGWLGFDPTNNCLIDHRHIRVAVGRDYADIPPTKGVFYGGGKSNMEVKVKVTPLFK